MRLRDAPLLDFLDKWIDWCVRFRSAPKIFYLFNRNHHFHGLPWEYFLCSQDKGFNSLKCWFSLLWEAYTLSSLILYELWPFCLDVFIFIIGFFPRRWLSRFVMMTILCWCQRMFSFFGLIPPLFSFILFTHKYEVHFAWGVRKLCSVWNSFRGSS